MKMLLGTVKLSSQRLQERPLRFLPTKNQGAAKVSGGAWVFGLYRDESETRVIVAADILRFGPLLVSKLRA
ncbi:MAG: hypothetical protein N2116_03215 [Armatimonadetes bacterium]|nr:hypothetical protein [Armatimonadota bacterium]